LNLRHTDPESDALSGLSYGGVRILPSETWANDSPTKEL
jgi:hypothetical protein